MSFIFTSVLSLHFCGMLLKAKWQNKMGNYPLGKIFICSTHPPLGYLKGHWQTSAFMPEQNQANILNIHIVHMQTKLYKAISCVRINKMPPEYSSILLNIIQTTSQILGGLF